MTDGLHQRSSPRSPLPPARTEHPDAVPGAAPPQASRPEPPPEQPPHDSRQGGRAAHAAPRRFTAKARAGARAKAAALTGSGSRSAGPTASTGQEAPAKSQAKARDPFFDNAKYLAIVLVALGHSWEPLRDDSRAAAALYIFVYAFHMPAFMVISGYFSRSFQGKPHQLKRLVTGIAVPYILFEIAYTLFKRYADDDPGYPISLLDPWYLTWFLIALFIWRLTTPLWKMVRWPVPLALGIAVLASISPDIGDDLDLQRVLQFLPFFVIGLFLKPEHFDLVRTRQARLLSVPVVLASLVFSYWAVERMNSQWFYHRDSAQELGVPWWVGVVMTLAMFGCSMVLTACFLAWVPRRHMWFTVLGAGTLYGYLLHGFLAKGSRFWDWYEADWPHTPWGAVVVTVIAAAVVTVLCTTPVQRVFRFAMEPKMTWAFKEDPAAEARRRVSTAPSGSGAPAPEPRQPQPQQQEQLTHSG